QRDFEIRRDDEIKLLALAPWQFDAFESRPAAGSLLADLLPSLLDCRRTQARLEQRLGLFRGVEAIRLYAADHDGRLPGKLDDIHWPLPADPFTGKPFSYAVEGETASLHGRVDHSTTMHGYAITIRK